MSKLSNRKEKCQIEPPFLEMSKLPNRNPNPNPNPNPTPNPNPNPNPNP